MGEHKTKKSKKVIEAIVNLGNILNYQVKVEYPMQQNKSSPQSIDVAWFTDEQSDYPIMIFEIESKALNYVSNNPIKVFGKENKDFEKPLFFFHIFIDCGLDTEKIKDLGGMFGKYNYRIYKLSYGEADQLIIDILAQHRRISYSFNLYHLFLALCDNRFFWSGIDIIMVLKFVETKIHYSEERTLLPVYATMSKDHVFFKEQFIRVLQSRIDGNSDYLFKDQYDSYIGQEWAYPIYIGILSYVCKEKAKKDYYFSLFKNWQENGGSYRMIGPYFGLSRDYDIFILGYAGALLALICCLMKDTNGAVHYILNQGIQILKNLEEEDLDYSFYTAIWLLHIGSSCKDCKESFEYIKNYINDRGGINENLVYAPPSVIIFDENNNEIVDSIDKDREYVIDFEEFNIKMKSILKNNINQDKDIIDFAFELLLSEKTVNSSTENLLYYLRQN